MRKKGKVFQTGNPKLSDVTVGMFCYVCGLCYTGLSHLIVVLVILKKSSFRKKRTTLIILEISSRSFIMFTHASF